MNVLICIPCLMTGGTEIQTLNLVNALIQYGHTVKTVCYFEHSDDMVKRYKSAGSEVICLSETGIRIHGWKSIIFLYKGLKQTVKSFKPDIVHVQYMAPGAVPVILLKILGIKNILATAHTFGDIYKNLWLVHFLQKYMLRAFTCITELAEQSFFGASLLYSEKTVLQKRNHFTIYNSLPETFVPINIERNPARSVTIGVVSRLETIKGMDLVIPAFRRVLEHHLGTKLIIVGDGSLNGLMHKQAEDTGCAANIEWVGRQPQESLPDWYAKMDIVLMPSRSEGFGLTAIEAMSCGCVVVAAKTGGLPEIVKDKKVGLLHEPNSVDDISNKILYLINNRNTIAKYSISSVKYSQNFNFCHYAHIINDVYSKLK